MDLLGGRTLAHSLQQRAMLMELGVPEAVAADVGNLFDLDGAVGIAELSAGTGMGPGELVGAFTRIGAGLGLDWAQASGATMTQSVHWERLMDESGRVQV